MQVGHRSGVQGASCPCACPCACPHGTAACPLLPVVLGGDGARAPPAPQLQHGGQAASSPHHAQRVPQNQGKGLRSGEWVLHGKADGLVYVQTQELLPGPCLAPNQALTEAETHSDLGRSTPTP